MAGPNDVNRTAFHLGTAVGLRSLDERNSRIEGSLNRLSTGIRIRKGMDGPSDLVAAEHLRAERTAIDQAVNNGERAEQLLDVAEGGMIEIQDLLNRLHGTIVEASSTAGLSLS